MLGVFYPQHAIFMPRPHPQPLTPESRVGPRHEYFFKKLNRWFLCIARTENHWSKVTSHTYKHFPQIFEFNYLSSWSHVNHGSVSEILMFQSLPAIISLTILTLSLRCTWTPDSCHIFWLVQIYLIRILGELSDLTNKNVGCSTKFVSHIHSESFLKGEYIPNISWDILTLNVYSLLIWNAKVTGNLCFIWRPLFQEIGFLYSKALISCCASMKPSYSPGWTPDGAKSLTAELIQN